MGRETPVLPFLLNTVGNKSSKEQGEEKKKKKKQAFSNLTSNLDLVLKEEMIFSITTHSSELFLPVEN